MNQPIPRRRYLDEHEAMQNLRKSEYNNRGVSVHAVQLLQSFKDVVPGSAHVCLFCFIIIYFPIFNIWNITMIIKVIVIVIICIVT